MEYPIPSSKYINQLIIKGLWNRFDVNWTLNPDVNILVGENGTGKSTILNLIANRWDKKEQPHHNEPYLELGIMPNSPQSQWMMLPSASESYKSLSGIDIQFIKTFDAPFYTLTEKEMKRKPYIKSTLDEELENAIAQYVDYQLNISNEIIFNKVPSAKAFAKKLLFIETINRLFQITGKVMDVKDSKLAFKLSDGTKINWYDLSSGEKQLLIILLTVLCQNEKSSILILDEPEISLHLRWQYELIPIIRKINPHCQLLIATHSPSIYGKGWRNKVTFIENIISPLKQQSSIAA
jgi:predicted ATPase